MNKLIREIHRRSMWQVLGIYLGTSWLVLQMVDTMAGALSLPDWAASLALFLLIIGLPVVLATAFVQGGMTKKEADAAPPSSADAAKADATEVDPQPTPSADGKRRWLTWRNALLGGVGAFALLGLLSAGWLISRTLGVGPAATLVAQGVLDERATIVLADFAPSTNRDAQAATEAFRVDLSKSRVLRLAGSARVNATLARMERDPTLPLDREAAYEVAVREGLPAVIVGEINQAGVGYVFSASLISQPGEEVLVSYRVSAADSTEVLDAIEELSKKLRERIGESLGQIRNEAPLSQVTTSDLAALRMFSQARRYVGGGGDMVRGRALYEEAVALDTAFASAWGALGVLLLNLGEERALRLASFERAFRHRDRLTEGERYRVEELYYSFVLGDAIRASTTLESWLEIDPDDEIALTNLSDKYLWLRRYDQAEVLGLRAVSIDPFDGAASWNASEAMGRQGKFDEAISEVSTFLSRSPNPFGRSLRAYLLASQGNLAAAEDTFRVIKTDEVDNLFMQATSSIDLASVAAARGEVGAALMHLDEAVRANLLRDLPQEALRVAVWASFLEGHVLGDRDGAARRLRSMLERFPLATMDTLDRPYAELAEGFGAAGDAVRARELMTEMETVFPADLTLGSGYAQFKLSLEHPDRAIGEIALAEGDPDPAIEAFRRSDVGYCRLCALPGLARAYDAAGQRDSALVVWERFIETPESFRLASGDAIYRGQALERLGQLYDEQGDIESAAKYYAMFVELWGQADNVLQPRVQTAQARLEEILAQIG